MRDSRERRPGIALYLLAGFLALLALPIAWGGLSQAKAMEEAATESASQELQFAVNAAGRGVVDFFTRYRRVALELAQLAEAQEHPLQSRQWMQQTLRATHRGYPEILLLAYGDAKGIVTAAEPELASDGTAFAGTDYSGKSWFSESRRTGETAVGAVTLSRLSGRPTVGVGAPVHDKAGNTVGFVVVSIRLDPLLQSSLALSAGIPDATLVAVEGNGRVVMHPDERVSLEMANLADLPLYAPSETQLTVRQGRDESGLEVSAAMLNIPEDGLQWRLLVKRPVASIQKRVRAVRSGWLVAAAAALLSGLTFAIFAVSFIARPMALLSRLAETIGGGDLTQQPPQSSWWHPSETAALVAAMASMQRELRESLKLFSYLQQSLNDARVDIQSLVSEQGVSSEQQARQLEEVLRFGRELHETTERTSQDVEQIVSIAGSGRTSRREGDETMTTTLQELGSIQGQFTAIAELTQTLEAQVERLVHIYANIEDIASRSNILSINAAIEAMRAGELGKGFTVIASSIRELNDSSQRGREQIRESIRQAQLELRRASEQSLEGRAQIDAGLSSLRSSGENLSELASAVTESLAAAQSVATSMARQRSAAANMDATVRSLHRVMEELISRGRAAEQAVVQVDTLSQELAEILGKFRA